MEADSNSTDTTGCRLSLSLALPADQSYFKESIKSALESCIGSENFINFDPVHGNQSTKVKMEDLKQCRMAQVKEDMILTQSIAVVMFNLDTSPNIPEVNVCRLTFGKSPWRFHHIIERNSKSNSTNLLHVRMEYHELSKELPLFSAGLVHYGTRILRINVFTHDFSSMVDFYTKLLGKSPATVKEGFCIFSFKDNEFEVQLALKMCSRLISYPLNTAQLVFHIPSIPSSLRQLASTSDDAYCLIDPDSNTVIVRETNKEQSRVSDEKLHDHNYNTISDFNLNTSSYQHGINSQQGIESKTSLSSSLNLEKCPDVIPDKDKDRLHKQSLYNPTLVKLGYHSVSNSCNDLHKLKISSTDYSPRQTTYRLELKRGGTLDEISNF